MGSMEVEEQHRIAVAAQRNRVETLGVFSALLLVLTSAWYAWPGFQGSVEFLPRLGPSLVLLALALAIQDFVDYGSKHRSRLGAIATVAWAPLIVFSITSTSSEDSSQSIGAALVALFALTCLYYSKQTLKGNLRVMRYRGIMSVAGASTAMALTIASEPEQWTLGVGLAIAICALIDAGRDIFGNDADKEARKRFKSERDDLEVSILQLRADGVQVDQAASLLQTATEIGYTDPKEGSHLVTLAKEDIERTIALSQDISAIKEDAAKTVAEADNIAPTARRPARTMLAGEREAELGSLREAELLYRKAKKHASEIVEYWRTAEEAIAEAKRQLSGKDGTRFEELHNLVREAEKAMEKEAPAQALELVSAIPNQLSALTEAGEGAAEAIAEVADAIEAAEGIDDADFQERLAKAKEALDEGDSSLARGTADSLLREIKRESEAMVEVQKAIRQRKKLQSRWSKRNDASEWEDRLEAVRAAAKRKQWSHAATLLERLTKDLDMANAEVSEARELFDFLADEWRTLRERLEKSGIKVDDAGRVACEGAIGTAREALDSGDAEACLVALGEADGLMEDLRRRA